MITNEVLELKINLDELPITIEQVERNIRKMGHLLHLNLRDRTKTRPAIYKLLKDRVINKEDVTEMLIPKPRRQSMHAKL